MPHGDKICSALLTMPHYDKAPVVEAVIDIQTRFKEPPTMAGFEACQAQLALRFPKKEPIQILKVGFNNAGKEAGWQTDFDQSLAGLRLSPADNSRVLQLQSTGFTYSHMPAYTSWDIFEAEARDLWKIFVETCEPESVSRCAVRFINRINIPLEKVELSDYFHLSPNIPKGIPQHVNGMFMQLQMPQLDLGLKTMAVINLAVTEPEQPGQVSVLLDFDVFCVEDLSPLSDEVWESLNQFRLRKNLLFEACITDNTRELIK